jgi:hypothetical protein
LGGYVTGAGSKDGATAAGACYLWRLEAARQDPTLTVLEKPAKALKVKVAALLK